MDAWASLDHASSSNYNLLFDHFHDNNLPLGAHAMNVFSVGKAVFDRNLIGVTYTHPFPPVNRAIQTSFAAQVSAFQNQRFSGEVEKLLSLDSLIYLPDTFDQVQDALVLAILRK